MNPTVLSASSLEGDSVKNAQGEDLGKITEIMIDTETHEIAYYVLSFGGFMGMGDDLFAVPPEAMTVDTANKCFVLNVEKDKLKNAEGFDKDHWPNMADQTFRKNTYAQYGLREGGHRAH
ncbi:PRC-barrel domain-containing protein [Microbulbifer elongatus]|uniref:PRC-barrel domain-containing protein n=1 Tax=Microbulbifer elongatus TaxID=86173 RepID=A0ABT1P2F4_9GAMM|nr:PRC-barrel domain-containing protein [Microbulbifer elongatus]MCQ3830307.1 PRC-barrel domain-containing protein [Microbulbifer elongatus]